MSAFKTARHLRLVAVDGVAEPSTPPGRKKLRDRRFTSEQQQKLAVALRNLKRRYGTWRRLAEEMGMAEGSLIGVLRGRAGSMGMAARAAQAAGVTVERLMSGVLTSTSTGKCPHCGQKLPEPEKE